MKGNPYACAPSEPSLAHHSRCNALSSEAFVAAMGSNLIATESCHDDRNTQAATAGTVEEVLSHKAWAAAWERNNRSSPPPSAGRARYAAAGSRSRSVSRSGWYP